MDLALAYLLGQPQCTGVIRRTPEDFQVDEVLGFEPEGEGEHLFVHVRKRGDNTLWVARKLAEIAGISARDVSYSGLKDRQALTTQWFSLHLPGVQTPDLAPLSSLGIEVLACHRHRKKLRSGVHQGNRFRIRLRDLQHADDLEMRLDAIARLGVPNYFGEQRFGLDGGNLDRADAMFRGDLRVRDRKQRGFYLSAARSYLFNLVVSERVRQGSLGRALVGEPMMLAGRHSLFLPQPEDVLQPRLDGLEIHPTGPLWGRGRSLAQDECAAWEADILADYRAWQDGLERAGLHQERRALRLRVEALSWERPADGEMVVSFYLPSGAFATSVLRELCDYQVHRAPPGEFGDEGQTT